MIWGWLAFLLSPAIISWKEEQSANNSTNIAVVFISFTAEPPWSDLQSWNQPEPGTMKDDLLKTADHELANTVIIEYLNHRNVNINARFAPTLNQQTFPNSARLSQPVTIMWQATELKTTAHASLSTQSARRRGRRRENLDSSNKFLM